jgi:hypothetical protein
VALAGGIYRMPDGIHSVSNNGISMERHQNAIWRFEYEKKISDAVMRAMHKEL